MDLLVKSADFHQRTHLKIQRLLITQILLILVYKGHQKSHFQVWRFVTAVANHNCLNLPATFMQPGNDTSGEPCAAGNEGLPSSFL